MQGLFEESDLLVDVLHLFDILAAGGPQMEIQGVSATGSDIGNELREIFALVGALQRTDVVVSLLRGYQGHGVAVPDEDHVHQEPGHTPVPVVEGVNADEAIVERGGNDDRMLPLVLALSVPLHEITHG